MSAPFDGRRKEYVDYHHLTEVPASIAKWKNRSTSLEVIEQHLHMKLGQRCTTDKQMYNEILRLFKDQYRRSGRDESCMTGINKADFHQMLAILGLFATKEQADHLFEKYDTNHSGNLSIHEFWVQCRPQDYHSLPGFEDKQKIDEAIMNRARKRMYVKESLLHCAVPPPVPAPTVYSIPLERLLTGIRDKIRQNAMVDYTLSTQRTRRYLQKLFEYNDPEGTGCVSTGALKRVLDHINYSAMAEHFIAAFSKSYPGSEPGTINYIKLVYAVYPQETSPILTSGFGQSRAFPPDTYRPYSASSPPRTRHSAFSGSMTQRQAASRPQSSMARFVGKPVSRGGSMTSRAPRPPSQGLRTRSISRPGSRAVSRSFLASTEVA